MPDRLFVCENKAMNRLSNSNKTLIVLVIVLTILGTVNVFLPQGSLVPGMVYIV